MIYRRADIYGGTYFFTVNLAELGRTLLVDHIEHLRNVVRLVKSRHPFVIDAIVILPVISTRCGRFRKATRTIRRDGR